MEIVVPFVDHDDRTEPILERGILHQGSEIRRRPLLACDARCNRQHGETDSR